VLERRTTAQAAQFRLDHCSQIAGGVVTKLNHAARLAFEHDNHASSDLGCWNCHYLFDLSALNRFCVAAGLQPDGDCKRRV
jgi:hypothetical protein